MNPPREPFITFPPYRFAKTRQKSLVFYALTHGLFLPALLVGSGLKHLAFQSHT